MPSPKQQEVLNYLRIYPEITLDRAVNLIGGDIYANKHFHVGNVLGRMVKNGMLCRVKRGVYAQGRRADLQQPLEELPLWKSQQTTGKESTAKGSSSTQRRRLLAPRTFGRKAGASKGAADEGRSQPKT